MKANGYVLHEDSQRVVIATGFASKSENVKTGSMIQVWILAKSENPLDAIKSGNDAVVCGSCPLRGTLGKERACYVNLGQAPLAVWRKWSKGGYDVLQFENYGSMFRGRAVRFGAYGDPAFIPFHIVEAIAFHARKHTGYTHQWQNPLFAAYKRFVMASADSLDLAAAAHRAGWRTFRILDSSLLRHASEMMCVNTTHGLTCEQCGLCNGASSAKSIVIEAHGTGKVHVG